MKQFQNQPWLENRKMDLIFILLPALIPLVLIILFQDYFSNQTSVTVLWWILLVLSVDVAHVYSTLFRFYWEKDTFQNYKSLLIIIPIASLLVGIGLHLLGPAVFWRVIAYLAVFHFIRQQYGFMRLYSRNEHLQRWSRLIDSLAIYNATLYPIIYWHFHLTENLHWFVEGDFLVFTQPMSSAFYYLYWIIIIVYVAKELIFSSKNQYFNIPKNLLILGTYLSWYLGIITFQGDLIFTMFNVLAHGIPYMALVFFFSRKKSKEAIRLPWKSVSIFLITILIFSYLEEGFWDAFIWRDHENLFPVFAQLPSIENPIVLSLLVPLLALPQITHYVLDGFIWKISKK